MGDVSVEAVARVAAATDVQTEHVVGEIELRRLGGGLNNPVVGVSAGDARWCAKIFRGSRQQWAAREWWALEFLARKRAGLAPQPEAVVHTDDATTVVVMEFVEGEPIAPATAPLDDFEDIAECLSALYAIPREQTKDDPGLAMGSPEKIVARVRNQWPGLEHDPRDELQRRAHELWRIWLSGEDADIVLEPKPLVFCRGDGNLRNWMRANGQLRLIDFEYSGWTTRDFDLADTIEHVSGRDVGETPWEALLAGLALDSAERARIAAGRRTYAIFWLMKLWPPRADGAPPELQHAEFAGQVERAERVLSTTAPA